MMAVFPEPFASVPFAAALLVVLGLCMGSFLNVVVHRLPRGESLIHPRSRCPHCGHPIAAYDNVPLVSYLVLRGRCRSCRGPISARYPVVELAGAACVVLGAFGAPGIAAMAVRSVFLLSMLAVTLIDLDHRIIPDEISLPGAILGIAVCPLLGVPRLEGILGALGGAGSLLAVALFYRWVRRIDGMGMGDVKLAGMMGAFLGWKGVLLTLILGSLLGSLLGIALLALRRAHGRTALPYGSFLAPAAGFVLLAGAQVWAWYAALLRPQAPGSW
jgi:leader peptidase (prepilin peptidase)/N-methyltransferase